MSEPSKSPRWRLPTLVGLVVLAAIGLLALREYRDPRHTWRRAIRGESPDLPPAEAWKDVRDFGRILGLDHEGTVEMVLEALDDPTNRMQAVATLAEIGADPVVSIPRLAPWLDERDPGDRIKVVDAIAALVRRGGLGRDEAVAALKRPLADPDPKVRREGLIALGQVIYKSGKSTDPLLTDRPDDPALPLAEARLVDEPDPALKIEAAYLLACNGRGEGTIPMLRASVRGWPPGKPLAYPADRALLALMALAVRSDEAASTLMDQLGVDRDGYPGRVFDALAWVAQKGDAARDRVRALAAKALDSDNPDLRYAASLVMAQIGSGPSAVPVLIEAIKDPTADPGRERSMAVRIAAIHALIDLATVDETVVPALKVATEDDNDEISHAAAWALQAIDLGITGSTARP